MNAVKNQISLIAILLTLLMISCKTSINNKAIVENTSSITKVKSIPGLEPWKNMKFVYHKYLVYLNL